MKDQSARNDERGEQRSGAPHPGCVDILRSEFVRMLTTDSEHSDRRRKDYNQALFMSNGRAVWSSTDLEMVMTAFDHAVRNVT